MNLLKAFTVVNDAKINITSAISVAHAPSRKEEGYGSGTLQTSLHSAGMFAHQSNCLSHMA